MTPSVTEPLPEPEKAPSPSTAMEFLGVISLAVAVLSLFPLRLAGRGDA